MKKIERQFVMGIIGSGLATFLTLVLAVKYHDLGVLSFIELACMFIATIFVARKSSAFMYAITGYFGIIKAIPMILSGNVITIAVVVCVLYLMIQGIIGLSDGHPTHKQPALSDSDKALMLQHGVEHNGQYFVAGGMDFDHLQDAVAHAVQASKSAT